MQQARQFEQGSLAWHKARAHRLTASDLPLALGLLGGVAELVSKKCILLKAICQGVSPDTLPASQQPALQWGRANEANAAAAYQNNSWMEGRPVTLLSASLWITNECPLLGASPDRFFKHLSHTFRIMEIKCP